MKKNVGQIERAIRVIAGLALMGAAYTGTLGVWAWIGVVLVATGLIGWCPPYAIFGINTCKTR